MWQSRLGPLGLLHWRIEDIHVVDETPGGPGAKATTQVSHCYDSCSFWFTKDFLREADERELDEVILHEWVHVAMRDLDTAVEDVDDMGLPQAALDAYSRRVGWAREGLVDRIARLIYDIY